MKRDRGQGNLAWGGRAAQEMKTAGPDKWTYIALIGGADTLSFRLRVAQSHLRPDMQPSYWSHAMLVLLSEASVSGAQAVHIPLLRPDTPEYAPTKNGVVIDSLSVFDDAVRYPNIALLAIPVPQMLIQARVNAFMNSRSTLDSLEHVLRWLAFSWGVAKTGNPLHENYGLPTACMLETVCSAEEFDLTPGLESRASCPEAIWIAARHWHDYYQKTGSKVPFGRYSIEHTYPILEMDGAKVPKTETGTSSGKSSKPRRK
jgi:hypothetical protein